MTPNRSDIAKLAAGRVLVVGDVMLDHYVSGRVSRVSDEAPVPVIHVASERWTAGGAANVAANIAALGGKAVLVGVVGKDHAAKQLQDVLGGLSGSVEVRLVTEAKRPTTIKTRYMGGQHQIVRVDREDAHAISAEAEAAMLDAIRAALPSVKAMVLSDYAKGTLTDGVLRPAIALARKAGVIVVVDPKRADWQGYAGADLITPNRKELALATGGPCVSDEDCIWAAGVAQQATDAAVLLTRSENGMSLYRDGERPLHLAAKAREVFDVSGAGDTVAAAIALGLGSGLAIETAMAIANVAAGIVVGKRGTATASPAELNAELDGSDRGGPLVGALGLEEAKALRRRWGEEGRTVGFTNGCFDILHAGHVSLLRQAAANCDRLIVALNSDASVKRLKGPDRPAQDEASRAAVMAAIKGVDAVVIFGEDTPLEIIKELQPDVLVKGADYAEDRIVGADIVRARGGRIVRADLEAGYSTTRILEHQAKKPK